VTRRSYKTIHVYASEPRLGAKPPFNNTNESSGPPHKGELRANEDVRFQSEFAAAIREHFPRCPAERAEAIARHAATRGSGRVGRSAGGRALDPDAVYLAVVASVRHVDTDYDELLMLGVDRETARSRVWDRVDDVVNGWRATSQ
jgi:hypothetical protein